MLEKGFFAVAFMSVFLLFLSCSESGGDVNDSDNSDFEDQNEFVETDDDTDQKDVDSGEEWTDDSDSIDDVDDVTENQDDYQMVDDDEINDDENGNIQTMEEFLEDDSFLYPNKGVSGKFKGPLVSLQSQIVPENLRYELFEAEIIERSLIWDDKYSRFEDCSDSFYCAGNILLAEFVSVPGESPSFDVYTISVEISKIKISEMIGKNENVFSAEHFQYFVNRLFFTNSFIVKCPYGIEKNISESYFKIYMEDFSLTQNSISAFMFNLNLETDRDMIAESLSKSYYHQTCICKEKASPYGEVECPQDIF